MDSYWLQEIFIYLIHRASGLIGLTLVNSMIVATVIFFIGWKNPEKNISWQTKCFGMVWLFLAGHPRGYGWGEKASFVSLGFLALLFLRCALRRPLRFHVA